MTLKDWVCKVCGAVNREECKTCVCCLRVKGSEYQEES